MLLQKICQRAFQLPGAVPVNEANRPVIGQQRLVEKPFGAGDRLIHRAADDVQVGDAMVIERGQPPADPSTEIGDSVTYER